MQFSINVNELMPQLTQVASMVGTKNTMPILACVMFEINDGGKKLLLTTSDSESWLTMTSVDVDATEDAKFCINAKDLTSTLRNLSNKSVEFTLDNETHNVIGKYDKGTFNLPYYDVNEYPLSKVTWETESEGKIPAISLFNAIVTCDFATANDELRPQMNGIHLDFDEGSMTGAATDGRKLVRYRDFSVKADKKTGITIPKKPAHILMSILAKKECDIKVFFANGIAVFECEDFSLVTRLTDARYPNYNSVIPSKEGGVDVIVNKERIADAVKRVVTFGNANTALVALCFKDGGMEVQAEDLDFQKSAKESVDCDIHGELSMRIGFNGNFLIQAITNVNHENIRIRVYEVSRPIVIEPETQSDNSDYTSILMPIMLN